jgi:hypothetical protein
MSILFRSVPRGWPIAPWASRRCIVRGNTLMLSKIWLDDGACEWMICSVLRELFGIIRAYSEQNSGIQGRSIRRIKSHSAVSGTSNSSLLNKNGQGNESVQRVSKWFGSS